MCGITGWIDWNRDLRKETEIVKKMTRTLAYRGPDDSNIWSIPHASFGHTRLVVVDPKGGVQPMTKSVNDRSYTMVYNGELYNTEDIRRELVKKGYTFQSHSDTEVLLTAYIEWKEACVDHLNGIYAFVIWDQEEQRVFAARDRLGVKPFFFYHKDGMLLFASEIKAILAHNEVKAEVDREGLQELFGLGPSRTPGNGVFKGISELRPAHAFTFNRNGLKVWRYWNVVSKPHEDSLDETVDRVRFLVKDAVERQLVADVPVCTFLSGGVDSSAISALAASYFKEQGRGALHTYSIEYEENSEHFQSSHFQPDQDGPWIRKMQEHIGSIHHSAVIDNEELANRLKDAVLARDLPGMADVDSSLLWFCEQIKREFTVGLSGECADEIFGGYPWFHQEDLLNSGNFPWIRSLNEREQLLLPKWRNKLSLKSYVKDKYNGMVAETPQLDGEGPLEARRREMFYINMLSFMTTLLDRKDRMSMGASLEVRVPFADHRIVEYAWNIPWEMKRVNGLEKGILRKALEGTLPHEILYRKKSPYPKTHHPGYTAAVKGMLSQMIKKGDSPLLTFMSKQKIEELIQTDGSSFQVPWFGQLMTGPQLIAHLAQMHMWFEEYNIRVIES
ncbi:asparagine synthase (glutamine-hydrolyzing) [Bacillus ectoiniformans]|uniref:asparagine synthase (glutamine-hydrolyzing) n=1 Tax=Bacillus ectoiniformans TaxID=1494429 RepID=UPI001957D454|nr:asparagine synthase (glutamine-hydrolyzing) [Bacillus ectoiniformans]MBM7649458.1 asparagine synthase (glutamine-hydrolyzing) [Bacillus ectoiniformans]